MNPQQRREQQAKSILKNREDINKNQKGWMTTAIVAVILFILSIGWSEYRTHDMEECEERLFEKLTKQKAPTRDELNKCK